MTRAPTPARLFLLALLLAAAGCAELQKSSDAPKAAAPQITESMLRDRAKEQLSVGIRQYEAGEYDAAMKSLAASLDHGLLSKADQSVARKNLAFIHCVSNREAACHDEFRKAFEINPDFSLGAAEDGHPIWGPVYRNVRTQLITEREAVKDTTRPVASLAKAEQLLADGMLKYNTGDYDAALKLLDASVKEGLKEKADKVRAMKHIAFSHCLKERYRDCRAAFVKIYEVEPAFDLTPAEVGHPSWTKTFTAAKAQALKAQNDRAAKDAREKSQPKPAAASVPKKN